jgi:hypothetical protein
MKIENQNLVDPHKLKFNFFEITLSLVIFTINLVFLIELALF